MLHVTLQTNREFIVKSVECRFLFLVIMQLSVNLLVFAFFPSTKREIMLSLAVFFCLSVGVIT